ncbi:MAG: hypothetical protein HY815_11195 [Candidatus Riflebacteria bacterium]|nr:hypothetical protein [Candidatus Riflebacteria bacterium]
MAHLVARPDLTGQRRYFSQASLWSQTRQALGWPENMSSSVRSRKVRISGVLVRTTMPSSAGVVHDVG